MAPTWLIRVVTWIPLAWEPATAAAEPADTLRAISRREQRINLATVIQIGCEQRVSSGLGSTDHSFDGTIFFRNHAEVGSRDEGMTFSIVITSTQPYVGSLTYMMGVARPSGDRHHSKDHGGCSRFRDGQLRHHLHRLIERHSPLQAYCLTRSCEYWKSENWKSVAFPRIIICLLPRRICSVQKEWVQ